MIVKKRANKPLQKIENNPNKSDASNFDQTEEKLNYKGWGMNNSPFRTRRSGLTWGGGNIKGSNAQRGSRKGFLK